MTKISPGLNVFSAVLYVSLHFQSGSEYILVSIKHDESEEQALPLSVAHIFDGRNSAHNFHVHPKGSWYPPLQAILRIANVSDRACLSSAFIVD